MGLWTGKTAVEFCPCESESRSEHLKFDSSRCIGEFIMESLDEICIGCAQLLDVTEEGCTGPWDTVRGSGLGFCRTLFGLPVFRTLVDMTFEGCGFIPVLLLWVADFGEFLLLSLLLPVFASGSVRVLDVGYLGLLVIILLVFLFISLHKSLWPRWNKGWDTFPFSDPLVTLLKSYPWSCRKRLLYFVCRKYCVRTVTIALGWCILKDLPSAHHEIMWLWLLSSASSSISWSFHGKWFVDGGLFEYVMIGSASATEKDTIASIHYCYDQLSVFDIPFP